MRKKEILLPWGAKTKLAKDTGLSEICVRDALRGITNTENSRLIRNRALKYYGGVEVKNR